MDYRILSSIVLSIIVLTIVPGMSNAYACDFALHPERCTKELVDDIIKKTVDPVLHDLDKEIIRVEHDAEKDFEIVKNDVKSLESDLVKEIKIIEKDVVKIVDDAESIESALVNDVVKDVKIIKEDITKISNFVETADKDIERTIEAAQRLEKILAHDVFVYFWYIVGAIIAILLAILGHRIYESWRKREVADAILEINKNLKKLVEGNKSPLN
jgi:hypothetical protein